MDEAVETTKKQKRPYNISEEDKKARVDRINKAREVHVNNAKEAPKNKLIRELEDQYKLKLDEEVKKIREEYDNKTKEVLKYKEDNKQTVININPSINKPLIPKKDLNNFLKFNK